MLWKFETWQVWAWREPALVFLQPTPGPWCRTCREHQSISSKHSAERAYNGLLEVSGASFFQSCICRDISLSTQWEKYGGEPNWNKWKRRYKGTSHVAVTLLIPGAHLLQHYPGIKWRKQDSPFFLKYYNCSCSATLSSALIKGLQDSHKMCHIKDQCTPGACWFPDLYVPADLEAAMLPFSSSLM